MICLPLVLFDHTAFFDSFQGIFEQLPWSPHDSLKSTFSLINKENQSYAIKKDENIFPLRFSCFLKCKNDSKSRQPTKWRQCWEKKKNLIGHHIGGWQFSQLRKHRHCVYMQKLDFLWKIWIWIRFGRSVNGFQSEVPEGVRGMYRQVSRGVYVQGHLVTLTCTPLLLPRVSRLI